MSKSTAVITNFTAGELSPRLFGRTDLKKYQSGVSEMENFVPQTHGGIYRRPGSKYIATANSPSVADIRLVEFQYSVDQTYVIEIGVTVADGDNGLNASPDNHGYIRFFRLDASGNPGILINTIPDPDVPTIKVGLPWVESEIPNLRFTQSADVLYVFCPTRPILKIRRTSTADGDPLSWSFVEHETKDGPYSNFNSDENISLSPSALEGAAITVSAKQISDGAAKTGTFAATDVGRHIRLEDDVIPAEVSAFVAGDTPHASDENQDTPATVTFTDMGTRKLFGDKSAAQAEGSRVEFYKCTEGVSELNDLVFTAREVTLTGTGGTFKLHNPDTSYADPFEGSLDHTMHIGYCRVPSRDWSGWGVITAVAGDGASCTVAVKSPFISTNQTINWRLGAWSKTTGYPKVGTFYQARLWAASTTNQPQTLWSSLTGAWSCFSPNTLDDGLVLATSAITVTLAENQVNEINNIINDTSGLIILTSGGEWLGRGSTPSAAITPEDMSFQKQSIHGCHASVEPVRAGSAIMFWQRDGEVCRELTYEFGQDRFVAPNLNILSEHITEGGVTDSALQIGKDTKLWFLKADGKLISCTYDRGQEVIAWCRHSLAPSNSVDAIVTSIATLRGAEQDMVWVTVKRNINGVVKTFIEVLVEDTSTATPKEDSVYLDSSITSTAGSPTATWGGLTHLIGASVVAIGDGGTFGPVTVSAAGEISLDYPVSKVTAGFNYESKILTMPITPTSGNQEYRGKFRRIYKVTSSLYRSKDGTAGSTETQHTIEYDYDNSTGLATGIVELGIPGNWGKEAVFVVKNDSVFPMNILSLVVELETGGV